LSIGLIAAPPDIRDKLPVILNYLPNSQQELPVFHQILPNTKSLAIGFGMIRHYANFATE
jgi:hypothetical protein